MSKVSSLLLKKAANVSKNYFKPQSFQLDDLQTPVFQTPSKWIKKDRYLDSDQRIQSYSEIPSSFFANTMANDPSRMCCLSRIVIPRNFLIRMQIMNNDFTSLTKFTQVLCPTDSSNISEASSAIYYPNSLQMFQNLSNKASLKEEQKGEEGTVLEEIGLEPPYYPSSFSSKDTAYIKQTQDVIYRIKLDKLLHELRSLSNIEDDISGDPIYLCFKHESNSLFEVTADSETSTIKTYLNLGKLFSDEPTIYEEFIEALNPLKKDEVTLLLNPTRSAFASKLIDFALFIE